MAKGKKTGGRKKGTPNTVTREVREMIKDILAGELDSIKETLNQAEPKDRLQFIIKLLPYTIPQYANVDPQVDKDKEGSGNRFMDLINLNDLYVKP